ncbi:peptidylprolyl isomerase [Sphingomicrobium flavum]|uniref:peptidylprolyl isomerase n=1 Tax=Sphingomicrobium flavum TaxID=1229164 RepID=UPI0021ADCEEA|nr:peptidylprolyl isomerase [Sphingomicrobium flavum]
MNFRKVGRLAGAGMISLALASMAGAQDLDERMNSAGVLNLPDNPIIYGQALPPVVKATAIVNGEVITATDIEQRVALVLASSEATATSDQLNQLRQQTLRNLIDETLQIQAAQREEIELTAAEISETLKNVAERNGRSITELEEYLRGSGSSLRSITRQIQGEMAWARLRQAKIESTVTVGDDEVDEIIKKLEASKGTTEYRVSEIYLASNPSTDAQVRERAQTILEQLGQGASFGALARVHSESTAAIVGGDLGWLRPEQLPEQIAEAVVQLRPGAVSIPIAIPGGYSIIAVQDRRTLLTADPRNALLSLKQITIEFEPGLTEAQATPRVESFAEAVANIGGCGNSEAVASRFGGSVVQSDNIRLRDLPPALQQMMLPMQVGQATRPFGSLEEGVRSLVICGRDEETPGLPSADQVADQINQQRVESRARRYLRDLRRDAIIDFR